MALASALVQLSLQWRQLCEAVREMRVTIVEDKPGDVMLADDLTNAADDMLGAAEEALALLAPGLKRNELDDRDMRSILASCHDQFITLSSRYMNGLSSYRHIAELVRLGRERGRAWQAWTQMVQAALEHTLPEMENVSRAQLACWQELAERAGMAGLTINTRAIAVGPLSPARERVNK